MLFVRNFDFTVGMALYLITHGQLLERGLDLEDGWYTDGHDLVDPFARIVEKEKPELVKCEIWYIGYEPTMRAWMVGVRHPMLNRYGYGNQIPRDYLVHIGLSEQPPIS